MTAMTNHRSASGRTRCPRQVAPGSDFLRPLEVDVVQAVLSEAFDEPRPGDRIGPYEVLELLGAGGMGCVYRARRTDGAEEVAIKMIAPHLVGIRASELLRRFDRERRILARLRHPGIAGLIDGGTTEAGRPYLAMELVRGEPIDRHADRSGLGLVERLSLLREVCAAVRHAHRHLVIHRDIKPSNVLVSTDGRVKLLDFGASRWLHDEAASSLRTGTADGAPLTLAYASPEQVRGESATIASDIYALGALLYLLLAGRPPHLIDRCSRYEAMRRICEERPALPSETCGCRSRAAALRGDLDHIAMMALRVEPHRRYETVERLDDDLRRHLERRTVRARGDGMGYRAATFMRRNRALTTVAGAVVLGGPVAALALASGYAQAQRAQRLAESERAAAVEAESAARMSLEFLEGMLASANAQRAGPRTTVVELLREAARTLDDRVGQAPTMEAGVRVAIGRTWAGLMRWDEALPQLEQAATLLRRSQRDPLALAESLSLLGRAQTHLHVGDAVGTQREALALRERALGSDHALVAESVGNLAFARWAGPGFDRPDAARCTQAERGYLDALARYRRLGLDRSRDAARFTMSLGCMYARQGRLEEAERRFDEALAIYAGLPASDDLYEITTLRISADVLEAVGHSSEALARLRTCRDRLHPGLDDHFARHVHWRIAELAAAASGVDDEVQVGWVEYAAAVASDLDCLADRWSPSESICLAKPTEAAVVGPSAALRAAAWRLRADGARPKAVDEALAAALEVALEAAASMDPPSLRESMAPAHRWRALSAFLDSVRCPSAAEAAERVAAMVET